MGEAKTYLIVGIAVACFVLLSQLTVTGILF
jgi:hypothetical protein